MKPRKFSIYLAAFLVTGAPVGANPVERACNSSDRAAATRALCSCIGGVAIQTLNRGDQRQAAQLFEDPDAAEELRMSDNARDEAFWDRYSAFGDHASTSCG